MNLHDPLQFLVLEMWLTSWFLESHIHFKSSAKICHSKKTHSVVWTRIFMVYRGGILETINRFPGFGQKDKGKYASKYTPETASLRKKRELLSASYFNFQICDSRNKHLSHFKLKSVWGWYSCRRSFLNLWLLSTIIGVKHNRVRGRPL